MEKIIIAAVSQNNVIGKNGSIPWHSREELQHFKRTTMGYPIIMGRKTFESIGKPLKGRVNIVITRNPNFGNDIEGIEKFYNLKDAIDFCETHNYEKVFFIGGEKIYKIAVNIADILLITRMNFEIQGDTFFPGINPLQWQLMEEILYDEFTVQKFVRKK